MTITQRQYPTWPVSAGVSFANFPSAAGVSGKIVVASDLSNALLISDGTNWNPVNGHAVIANAYNVNLTVQSLSEALITAASFPANFVRARSRIRTWSRWSAPGIGTNPRGTYLRQGAAGAGLAGNIVQIINPVTSGTSGQLELLHVTTALGVNTNTKQSTNSQIGLHLSSGNSGSYGPVVNFTAPWEIAFTGLSCAETAQTILTASWAANVVTFGYTAVHSYAIGDKIVVSGMTPSGYNGTYIITSLPTTSSWTAELLTDPGVSTVMGSSARTSNVTLVDYIIEWLQ